MTPPWPLIPWWPDRSAAPFAMLLAGMALLTASCTTPASRRDSADARATAAGLAATSVPVGPFELAIWQRPVRASALTVYIEGDGLAWLDRTRPSPDPTPLHPLALDLALRDPTAAVAVVARPCQYQGASPRPQPLCNDPRWWTADRFTDTAVTAMGQALDTVKQRAGAAHLHLIGFSGGGAIAVLLATRRDDVDSLRTVAGNLLPDAVNRLHGVETPPGTLSPLDPTPTGGIARLAKIPQIHFSGRQDPVVPPEIAARYAAGLETAAGGNACIRLETVTAGHNDGWVSQWQTLLSMPLPVCRPR